jgi:hypothetical protein
MGASAIAVQPVRTTLEPLVAQSLVHIHPNSEIARTFGERIGASAFIRISTVAVVVPAVLFDLARAPIRRGSRAMRQMKCQKLLLNRASRKPPSLAVARNCGIGSRSLNVDVNALDRLHTERGWNSSYCGLCPPIWRKNGPIG